MASEPGRENRHFIQQIIDKDRTSGRVTGEIVTRFPPEPNGYLHIGHAKSICLNFGLAEEYGGRCHLRFDDTNPETEDMEYVESIKNDVHWLGYDWDGHLYFASDYFEQLYAYAEKLITLGKAYVDSQSMDEIRATRGTVTEPGTDSPYRTRPASESLDLFRRMRAGEFPDGAHVLRAKIDMAATNMLMRDPLLYRIRHAHHYRTGDSWCIYPMYDMAHPLEDAIENVSHSLCTLEFEVHRPLYDWLVDAVCTPPRPHQYEFARLNLDYTVMSKRKLLLLVKGGHVDGWDDPRMPTIAGMRRRGIRPDAIRAFCNMIGVAKSDNRVDVSLLEYAVRNDLNAEAPRVMAVLRPLKVVLTNWPEGETDMVEASWWPHDIPKEGTRQVPFSRELFIEQSDFMEDPPAAFHRLRPGQEVRLRYAYIIRCDRVIHDADGNVSELHCTVDLDSRSGSGAQAERRVKGTIHWVSAAHARRVEVRLYDRLFSAPDPERVEGSETFLDHLNPDSLEIITDAVVEPIVADAAPGTRYQFERNGYFYLDGEAGGGTRPVWNRIITLRDTWGRKSQQTTERVDPATTTRRVDRALKPEEIAHTPNPLSGLDEAGEARAHNLVQEFTLPLESAAVLAGSPKLEAWFRRAAGTTGGESGAAGTTGAASVPPDALANWLVQELRPLLSEKGADGNHNIPVAPEHFRALVSLHHDGTLSSRLARDVLSEMLASGDHPTDIVGRLGLEQISDEDALSAVMEAVLAAHPDRVAAYRDGKKGLIGFFMGQVMQKTGGKANPQIVRDLLEEALAGR